MNPTAAVPVVSRVEGMDLHGVHLRDVATGEMAIFKKTNAWIAKGVVSGVEQHCAVLLTDGAGGMTGISSVDATRKGKAFIAMSGDEFAIAIGAAISLGIISKATLAKMINS